MADKGNELCKEHSGVVESVRETKKLIWLLILVLMAIFGFFWKGQADVQHKLIEIDKKIDIHIMSSESKN